MTFNLGSYRSEGARFRQKRWAAKRKEALDAVQPLVEDAGRQLIKAADQEIAQLPDPDPLRLGDLAREPSAFQQPPRGRNAIERIQNRLAPPQETVGGSRLGGLVGGLKNVGSAIIDPIDKGLEAVAPFAGAAAERVFSGLPIVGEGGPLSLGRETFRIPDAQTGGDISNFRGIPTASQVGQATQFSFENPLEAAQREVDFFRPATGPAGRFLGRGFVESTPGVKELSAATGGRLAELGADVGEAVLPELAVPSNLIPFEAPLIGAGKLAFRSAGVAARNAPAIASVTARLAEQAPEAIRVASRSRPAQRLASESGSARIPGGDLSNRGPFGGDVPPTRPVTEGADLAKRGAAEFPPDVPIPQSGIRKTFIDAITRSGPGREGREAARIYQGAVNEGNLRITNWQNETRQLADRVGLNVVKNAGIERQSEETITIMKRIWGAIDPATGRTARGAIGEFPETQRPLIEAIYDRLDEGTRRILEVDPDYAPNLLDDYFPHLFKPSTGPGGKRLTTRVTGRRTVEGPLEELLSNRPGLDLVSWDPIEFVARHESAVNNYIASLEAIRSLKSTGAIRPKNAAPATWRRPDIASFRIGEKLQGFVAEPKVAVKLEDMFGVSAFKTNGFLKPIEGTRAALFKIKVVGGLFQEVDFSARSIGLGLSELVRGNVKGAVRAWFMPIRSTARAVNPALDRKLLRAAEGSVDLTDGYKAGLAAGIDPSIADEGIRGLGNLVPQTVAGKQIPGAEWVQQALEFISGSAYERFHRDILEQGYLVILQKNIRKGMSREEAVRKAVEETNVFFSSIPNWQSAVTNATARDALKIPFFATGELEAWFRLPVQAPAGFAGIIGATAIAAQMISKLSTGEWLSADQLLPYKVDTKELENLKKDPRTLLEAGLPGVNYNTRFLRPELPWKGPDGRKLYLDLLGQSDSPFRWALDPVFATQTRLGQFPRAALDLQKIVEGKAPAFGEKVDSLADLGRAAFQQVSPISISGLAGTERGRIGTTGAGIQTSGFNVSAEPLREVIARKFRENFGREYNPATDRRIAEQDPELASLFEASTQQGIRTGFEGAQSREQREQILIEQAERLRPHIEGVRAGNAQAGEQFRERYSELQTFMAGVSVDSFFDVDFGDTKPGVETLVDELRQLDPFTDEFTNLDPETGDFRTDWDAYDDRRNELIDEIESQAPGFRKAYEADLKLPEEFADVERQFKAARDLRNQLDDISPAKGIPPNIYKQIRDFLRKVNGFRSEMRRRGREVPLEDGIRVYGQSTNQPAWMITGAQKVRGGVPTDLRNPAWDRFLIQHESVLGLFYPSLYTARVERQIGGVPEEQSGSIRPRHPSIPRPVAPR